ncbi:hypothetical protein BDN70DRAFT_923702 [Pholiota conissans]|uniref:Late embryogenesis abundant protein LEA-2 subgroup domain-containing protein n=1 Tax=Pholiota conissans TaxID=109636 RepID=A0A9P6CXQ2_9AGAR|nr:hypothetical protein BDN70DRAFT_923702 [Pholiota conissans]
MAYQDPYTSRYAVGSSSRPQQYTPAHDYSSPYPPYQSQENTGGAAYDPYSSSNTRPYMDDHPDYSYGDNNGAGYNDYPPPQRSASQTSPSQLSKKRPSVKVVPMHKEDSGFDRGEFTPKTPGKRTPRALREYRYDHQGNLWAQGGRGRCIGRVCCCSLMTAVFLIVSIVLALALWIRPPSISVGDVETMSVDGVTIQQVTDGLQVNLGVNISYEDLYDCVATVQNPNYFSVDFKKIQADISYPLNNFPIGDGSANNIVFKSRSETNFTFPFALKYNSTADTGNAVILDIASKCGVNGSGQKQNIVVNYKITLGIRILLITISPVVSNQFNFPCPLSASDISKFLGGGGS